MRAATDREQLADAEHEQIVLIRRPEIGLRAIIAVHSTALGPALGGVRFGPYATFDDAVHDVLRLSRGMTSKAALAGLAQGGGKAVIVGDPAVDKTPELIDAFADAVGSLGGRYITAEDVGTTQADMDRIRRRTPYASGTSPELGGSGDPSPATASGVVYAMEAAAEHRWGTRMLRRRTVLVIGAGKVGGELVRLLIDRGSVVIVCDTDAARCETARRRGARVVAPADALRTSADVLSPCALGGVLTEANASTLPFEIVVGAANNQLRSPEVATRLAASGVLYVPDFLANAGGIINIAQEAGGYDATRAQRAVEAIRVTTSMVLQRAQADRTTPLAVADLIVAERLAIAERRVRSPST